MNTTTTHRAASGTSTLAAIALALLIIGGLNWALVGLFRIDLVAALFGDMSPISRFVYVVVGLAALVAIGLFARMTRRQITH
jgi:uncharacterized membrane protein YuzA (DUF378 family)